MKARLLNGGKGWMRRMRRREGEVRREKRGELRMDDIPDREGRIVDTVNWGCFGKNNEYEVRGKVKRLQFTLVV